MVRASGDSFIRIMLRIIVELDFTVNKQPLRKVIQSRKHEMQASSQERNRLGCSTKLSNGQF
jgi:hypothetical protein